MLEGLEHEMTFNPEENMELAKVGDLLSGDIKHGTKQIPSTKSKLNWGNNLSKKSGRKSMQELIALPRKVESQKKIAEIMGLVKGTLLPR